MACHLSWWSTKQSHLYSTKQSAASSSMEVPQLTQAGRTSPATSSSPREETGFLNWNLPMATRLRRWFLSHLGFFDRKKQWITLHFYLLNHYNTKSLHMLNCLLHVEKAFKFLAYSSVFSTKPGKLVLVCPFSIEQFNLIVDHTFPAHFLNGAFSKRSGCSRDLPSCTGYSSMICKAQNSMSCRLQPPNCPPHHNSVCLHCTHPPPHPRNLEKYLSEKRQFVQTILMVWLKLILCAPK